MHTEEEAKGKFCPMKALASSPSCHLPACEASKCMMWVWTQQAYETSCPIKSHPAAGRCGLAR
jgi:hypothetical protein